MSGPLTHGKATPGVAFCFLLNQLLERESWARERLVPFAGQSIEFQPPLLPPWRVTILASGKVEPGGPDPAAIAAVNGVTGGALAEEVRTLARHLRLDVEEELSRVFGDIAAHRMTGAARAFAGWQRDAALRLSEALGDYATDEARLLVRRVELAAFAADVESLARKLEDLERRMAALA